MRFELDTSALRAGAATIEEVLGEVMRLDVADDLRPVASAVPGGRCASGLPQVAAAWQARIASTRWELRELGRCVSLAADGYDAVELAARQALEVMGGGTSHGTGDGTCDGTGDGTGDGMGDRAGDGTGSRRGAP